MRTQVGIVGAGQAGLVLAHLLDLDGIDSVVLEARSRDYVEQRVRAGQQEVVKDLIAARVAAGGPPLFDVSDLAVHDLMTESPRISFRRGSRFRRFHPFCRSGAHDR